MSFLRLKIALSGHDNRRCVAGKNKTKYYYLTAVSQIQSQCFSPHRKRPDLPHCSLAQSLKKRQVKKNKHQRRRAELAVDICQIR